LIDAQVAAASLVEDYALGFEQQALEVGLVQNHPPSRY
jgi:hypothetical protein